MRGPMHTHCDKTIDVVCLQADCYKQARALIKDMHGQRTGPAIEYELFVCTQPAINKHELL